MITIPTNLPEIIETVGDSPISLIALMFVLLAALASLILKDSKDLRGISAFVGLLAFATFIVVTVSQPSPNAQVEKLGEPVQSGTYRSFNNYLAVYQKGERVCIQWFTGNGSNVASIEANSNGSNEYQVASNDFTLVQEDADTIEFAGFEYTREPGFGFTDSNEASMQQCLDSTGQFSTHKPGNAIDGQSE